MLTLFPFFTGKIHLPRMILALFSLIGFVLLFVGGDLLVRSSARLAMGLGVSPLMVGLTVEAFGTSAPELAVVIQSSRQGASDIVVGHILGSNIANILLILGLSAAIRPFSVAVRLIRYDVPVMIAATGILWLMAADSLLTMFEGGILLISLGLYLGFTMIEARRRAGVPERQYQRDLEEQVGEEPVSRRAMMRQALLVVTSLGMLILGARLIVAGAVALALWFGISELVVGLTIVAIGTSLPEITTCVMASARGDGELALGNAVGSNILNILCVTAIGMLLAPSPIIISADALLVDFPIMFATSLLCLPVFIRQFTVTRWEGLGMMLLYALYVGYLLSSAAE